MSTNLLIVDVHAKNAQTHAGMHKSQTFAIGRQIQLIINIVVIKELLKSFISINWLLNNCFLSPQIKF